MVAYQVTDIDITQAVLRLASVQDSMPAGSVEDIQLLIDAVDERASKLKDIEKDVNTKAYRDDIYGTHVSVFRIQKVLERIEQL